MNRIGRSLLVSLMLFAAGCAHQATTPDKDQAALDPITGQPMPPVKEVESFHLSDPEPPQVVDEELETIPDEMNSLVNQWINYFQRKGRPHMERYLSRSTRYSNLMKRILRQNGLPEDLIYVALIESGFSSKATSRAAAVGYWQFIKGTGRRYGLEVNSLIDERRDPVLSTQAASEYFKGLYSIFGSWYLSMASYNVGENRVKREVNAHYTRDFWELARRKRLPKETINYVPKFIAAKMIAKNPEKYGFTEIDYEKPIEFEMVKLDQPVNLRLMAAKMGVEYEDFKQINPKFRGEIAPLKDGSTLELRVPVGQTAVAMQAAKDAAVDKIELIADTGDTTTYKVRRGDSLNTIARKYRTSVAVIRDINDLKPGRKLRVGMRLQVPERSSSVARRVKVAEEKLVARREAPKVDDQEKAVTNPEVTTNGVTYYVVQAGDTLSAIADDYDSSIRELRRLNSLGNRAVLKTGMRLRVPPKDNGLPSAPEVGSPSVASGAPSSANSVTATAASGAGSTETSNLNPNANSTATATLGANPGPSTDQTPMAVSPVSKPELGSDAGSVAADGSAQHVVRSGENLSTIAKKYGTTIQALRQANGLKNRSVLKVGMRLVIPQEAHTSLDKTPSTFENSNRRSSKFSSRTTERRQVASLKKSRAQKPAASKVHVVRPGENLTGIAARYRVSLSSLTRKNNLHSASRVLVGARLLIPMAEAAE